MWHCCCISNLPLAYHLKIPLAKNRALLYRMHLPFIDSHHMITGSYFYDSVQCLIHKQMGVLVVTKFIHNREDLI